MGNALNTSEPVRNIVLANKMVLCHLPFVPKQTGWHLAHHLFGRRDFGASMGINSSRETAVCARHP